MSATLGINKIKVEAYGVRTTVPNDNIAKLMYYLDCVLIVIDYDRKGKLTDYSHYYNLNNEERKAVIELAILFNPKIFIDAKIFIVDPSLLPDSVGNKFYKITDETIGVHVNQQLMIGGRAVKVLNIMACDSNWLNRNYITPLERINNELRNRRVQTQQNYINTTEGGIIPYSSLPIVVNQYSPTIIRPYEFGTCPMSIVCMFCRHPITTNTDCECNCGSFCLCCLIGYLFFMWVQLCRGKSICCCDVIHKCPNCGAFLGKYTSC